METEKSMTSGPLNRVWLKLVSDLSSKVASIMCLTTKLPVCLFLRKGLILYFSPVLPDGPVGAKSQIFI